MKYSEHLPLQFKSPSSNFLLDLSELVRIQLPNLPLEPEQFFLSGFVLVRAERARASGMVGLDHLLGNLDSLVVNQLLLIDVDDTHNHEKEGVKANHLEVVDAFAELGRSAVGEFSDPDLE